MHILSPTQRHLLFFIQTTMTHCCLEITLLFRIQMETFCQRYDGDSVTKYDYDPTHLEDDEKNKKIFPPPAPNLPLYVLYLPLSTYELTPWWGKHAHCHWSFLLFCSLFSQVSTSPFVLHYLHSLPSLLPLFLFNFFKYIPLRDCFKDFHQLVQQWGSKILFEPKRK